jgi:hypothetical protein
LLEPLSALAKSAALRTGIEKTEQQYSDLLAAVWSGLDGDWGVVDQRQLHLPVGDNYFCRSSRPS